MPNTNRNTVEYWTDVLCEKPDFLSRQLTPGGHTVFSERAGAQVPKAAELTALCKAISADPEQATTLRLQCLSLTPTQCDELMDALAHNTHLSRFYFNDTPFTAAQLTRLAQIMKERTQPVLLDLSNCTLKDEHLPAISTCMQGPLHTLYLSHNGFSSKELNAVLQAGLKGSPTLFMLGLLDSTSDTLVDDDIQELLKRNQWLRQATAHNASRTLTPTLTSLAAHPTRLFPERSGLLGADNDTLDLLVDGPIKTLSPQEQAQWLMKLWKTRSHDTAARQMILDAIERAYTEKSITATQSKSSTFT